MNLEPVERGILANQFLAVLPDRQRDMVAKYYGLAGGTYTFSAIAEDYRLSTTRVQQIVISGIRKMRRLLPPPSRPKEAYGPRDAFAVHDDPYPRANPQTHIPEGGWNAHHETPSQVAARAALLEHNTREAQARWTGLLPTDPWTSQTVGTPEEWARILTEHDCRLA